MKLRTPLLLGAAATALVVGVAGPASAAPGDTSTTFALTAGSLAVSSQATALLNNAVSGTTAISGPLGTVSVTDNRGGTAAWTTSASSTAFNGALTTHSTSTAVSYTGGAVTTSGTITVAAGTATTMSTTAASVVAPSAVSGNNTASWAPTLNVTMPAGALVDSYSGTVTTSVA
jgi:hypothetical protein